MVVRLNWDYEDAGLSQRLANPIAILGHTKEYGMSLEMYYALRQLTEPEEKYIGTNDKN